MLEFLKNYAFSADGINVTNAKPGEKHDVPDSISQILIDNKIAKKIPKVKAPKAPKAEKK